MINEYDEDDDLIHSDLEETDDYFEESEEEIDDENISSAVREDKIFNNRYNTGEGLTDVEDYNFSKSISVSNDYSDSYLKDLYNYEEGLDSRSMLDTIFSCLNSNLDIQKIIDKSKIDELRIKVSKEDINSIFNILHSELNKSTSTLMYYSSIYIVEAISTITSMEYKKLFDQFDTEIQEMLLLELNEKYKFLDGRRRKKIH